MENVNNNSKCCRTTVTMVVVLATFLLMAFLVNRMIKITAPAPVGVARATERAFENPHASTAAIARTAIFMRKE